MAPPSESERRPSPSPRLAPPVRPTLAQRLFAWFMARGMAAYERHLAVYKRALFAGLRADDTVLEIGPGAGANLVYFPAGMRWIGVEPNPAMQPYLADRLRSAGLRAEVRAGSAEALPAEAASCDAVVSTLVLCSVRDVGAALGEIRRVLRPGGRLLFLEHVAAPQTQPLYRWQRRLRPLWAKLADGCQLDRDTARALTQAGFNLGELQRFDGPVWLVRPHLCGEARKSGGL